MPPLVYETAAWLRFFTCVPIPALPGETESAPAIDRMRSVHAVPVAGAVIGAVGGLILLIAWWFNFSPFECAALALVGMVVVTGGLAERALAASAERLGKPQPADAAGARMGVDLFSYGAIVLVIAILLRVGALQGLVVLGGAWTALALIAAGAVSRAAGIAVSMIRPGVRAETSRSEDAASPIGLQWLVLIALLTGFVLLLPFGIGPALAGVAAAAAAAAIVTAFAKRLSGDDHRELEGAAEQFAEIALLIAVLMFSGSV